MIAKNILNRKKIDPSDSVFTGNIQVEQVSLQLFRYNVQEYFEDQEFTVEKLDQIRSDKFSYWLNIHGIHDSALIKNVCSVFDIHQLAVQDILDVNQRPKFQEYDNYWFFSLKSILPEKGTKVITEQISFVLGKNYLISFQERKADYFDHIRERLRKNIGIVRERGTDYLLYLLLESILDNYFKTLMGIDEAINITEIKDLNSDLSPSIISKIESFKHELSLIKRTILPIKDFVSMIEREDFVLVDQRHIKYFFEIKDLCLTLMDECEQMELRLESNVNLFFSVQGHKMNQVMKTLTVVATIFIPLTFIAGVYGMNFVNMPELNWKWGYLGVWVVMFLVFIGMLFYFRKKRWF